MLKTILKNPLAFFLAIVVHAVLAAVLIASFNWTPQEKTPKMNVVNAVAVDESKVEKQIQQLKNKEERKKREDEARKQKLEREAQQAEMRRKRERDQPEWRRDPELVLQLQRQE